MHKGDETLEQLEDEDWGEPTYDSYLVRTIHALRRKSIREFSVEDLRITLNQNVGFEFLTPLALEQLEANPFASGDFYPGDLLVAVMRLPRDFWAAHPNEATRMAAIANRVAAEIGQRDEIAEIKKKISELLDEASWRTT